ncbi:hypothetical protein BDR22DRAFT_912903 [Usnea florida]
MAPDSHYSPLDQVFPNRHDNPEKDHQNTSADFDPNLQTWKLFTSQALRLVFTICLIALFVLTLVCFERAGNVRHRSKNWFNAFTTILNLALGINFLEAFKDMAKVLRWRVLARRASTIRETDLILGGDSLMTLWDLARESRRRPITMLACVLWILLNLLAQATIAMLSLNYSMDRGSGSTGTYTLNGNVSTPRLDCFFQNNSCDASLVAPQTTAHSFGAFTQGQSCCTYNSTVNIFSTNQSCSYFCSANRREFAYRFNEYNPLDTTFAYPYLTHRLITSKAKSPLIDSPDGQNDTQFFFYYSSTYSSKIAILRSAGGFNSTTYVYDGVNIPQNATLVACGPRCLTIYVLRLGKPFPANIFECQISVTDVTNTTAPWQEYPNGMARLAVASIALTGRVRHFKDVGMTWQQYQLYSWGNYLEAHSLDADGIGSNIAEFAMGSIATTALLNQKVSNSSPTLPILGYSPTIKWRYVIALFAGIAAVHVILVGLLCWIARPVVVGDDSDLCTARLLHGLVGRIPDGGGTLLYGRELAQEIENLTMDNAVAGGEMGATNLQEPTRVVYGVVETNDKAGIIRRRLGINEGIQPLSSWRGAFPKGQYA